ncbi:hypothetical protein OJAV_G00211410 [Oryzias javanicus]|uniref:Ig-like domain-containing protein n=1 Tax=Oryzias javanicus TaxID=123683 RepID=A0A437C2T4_ORYJA|nr:hypothetical protein OJAV_G00211410 [Oryzias javanicus]
MVRFWSTEPFGLGAAGFREAEREERSRTVRVWRHLSTHLGQWWESFLQRSRLPFCWRECRWRMPPELEPGLSALRRTSPSRGMRALRPSLWLCLLLPLCVTPARLPTAEPTDSASSESSFLEDVVLALGDPLEISCEVEDPSEPVTWFKDDAWLVPPTETRVSNNAAHHQRVVRGLGVYSVQLEIIRVQSIAVIISQLSANI